MDLDPRLLRYFIAVAEERHFSRAATRLHISQPPLSYAIRQLEDNVGARLLTRTSRHVELTDAGQVLYREALTLLRQAEEVRTLVQRVDAGLRGRLRIGFVGSMLYRGLPALLNAMRAELPDVEHVLTELNSHDQIEAVRRGEQDLGFIHANPVPQGVQARDLMAEPFMVCLPQAHPLAGRASLRLAELAADDFVFFARAASPSYYETVLSMCVAAGFMPVIRHEVRHWLSVASLVSQGLGVSIVPACLSRSGLAGTRFIAFEHEARSVSQMIWPEAARSPLQEKAVEMAARHDWILPPRRAARQTGRQNPSEGLSLGVLPRFPALLPCPIDQSCRSRAAGVSSPGCAIAALRRSTETRSRRFGSTSLESLVEIPFSFHPRLFDALRGYDRTRFVQDIGAGLTVAVVALPLAMAFAIGSGLKPEAGLFTSIIAGFLIALLGGSRVQIGGPAGAFIVIVYDIVQQYGVANLIIATALSGVLLFVMGLLRLGTLVRFIPVAVIIGFTNGIAVLIALSQVKDFLGLTIPKMPGDFFGILGALGGHLATLNPWAAAVALGSLAVIVGWQRWLPKWGGQRTARLARVPGSIVALVLATAAVAVFGLPVETIGSRFGGIPAALPDFTLPAFSWESARFLLMPTITLAALGAIESLLCARVADGMIGDRHDPNQELMAQGVANFVTPFFGGMPATGTIARTVTNVKSGATSPVAGMVHALVLLVVMLAAAPLAASIPLATLAAILMFVAWNMGEWREFARLRTYRLPYRVTLVSVFLLTVIFDLTVAVEFGIFAACLTFIYRISSLSRAERITAAEQPLLAGQDGKIAVWRLYGTVFFGATKLVESLEDRLPARALVLDLKNVIYVDSTGAEALEALSQACEKRGVALIVSGLMGQPQDIVRRIGLYQRLQGHLQPDVASATAAAVALADGEA